ncbi:MAG TPA: VTT domain-containing protein [Candidatus Saccharimonadales bacterium]|jgi:membrane-associated protein
MKRYRPLIIALFVLMLGGFAYLAIDHYGLERLINLVGVLGIAGIIFAESGLLIGFFLPGDSLLFTAGFLVSQNILDFNIHLLALILFVAAALGDSVGYMFGKRVGRGLFHRRESLLFHKDNLRRAEDFYEHNGAKTIVIARFVPVVRTFAPIIAGISAMPYRTFLIYNLIGAFVWAAGLTYIGYFAGDLINRTGINIEYVILAIIAISLLPPVIHVLREPASRKAIKRLIAARTRK